MGMNKLPVNESLCTEREKGELGREECAHSTSAKRSRSRPQGAGDTPTHVTLHLHDVPAQAPKPSPGVRKQQTDPNGGLSNEYLTTPPQNYHDRQGKNLEVSQLRGEKETDD